MKVLSTSNATAGVVDPDVAELLKSVSPDWLREVVTRIAVPRQATEQSAANAETAAWIESQLRQFGYETFRQGQHDNVVTRFNRQKPVTIVAAHYDSVPQTPGADDNASAVAAMLGCAKAIAANVSPAVSNDAETTQVCFVAFNLEEEGLAGSREFVRDFVQRENISVREVHVLEMVGYCDHTPGSQGLPKGLPVKLSRDAGDFLAIVANRDSNRLLDGIVNCGATYTPELPVLGLKVFLGMEKVFKDLLRSDHAPFWAARHSAFMWTDTSEFRNPHYHQPTDTPDTLDYDFLGKVTRLLIARVIDDIVDR